MRFKNTYLGFLWTAIEPLLYFTVLYVVFTSIRDREETFAIYLITGIMLFHIFARGTGKWFITTDFDRIAEIKVKWGDQDLLH